MVSLYDKNGNEKPREVYKAEVWARDLYKENLLLHLEHPGKKQTKIERKALLKEFRQRFGFSFSEYKR